MELQFLGHSCFLLHDGTSKVLTDPFLTGNVLAAAAANQVEADFIFVTHGHGDHVGDAVDIAKRTGATVCCTVDLAEGVFGPAGVKVQVGNLGVRSPCPSAPPSSFRPSTAAAFRGAWPAASSLRWAERKFTTPAIPH